MKKSIFGYGLTTKSIAKSGNWDIYDDKFSFASKDEFNNNLLPVNSFNPNKSSIEVTSPGISPNHFLIKNAKNLISEYDYFRKITPFCIWISGTNGKTTTTKMTGHLLNQYGAQIGGNVGIPLGNLDKKNKIWILETSSFTMHYTKFAKPDIYVLLPISNDHLTWHNSFKEYENAKLKILERMQETNIAILPKKYQDIKSKANLYFYENEYELAKYCGIKINDINFKNPFLIDALLALFIQKIIFDKCDITLINKFKIENNKLEEFKDKFNRIWVNDSKATNPDASINAIKRYSDKKIHLILGGDDKGINMKDFLQQIKNYNIHIYAIGSNFEKISNLSKNLKINYEKCIFLENAVKKIDTNLKIDEIALLSPACASLDQFKNYDDRGQQFKNLVNEL